MPEIGRRKLIIHTTCNGHFFCAWQVDWPLVVVKRALPMHPLTLVVLRWWPFELG
jgi:hypothetical protein